MNVGSSNLWDNKNIGTLFHIDRTNRLFLYTGRQVKQTGGKTGRDVQKDEQNGPISDRLEAELRTAGGLIPGLHQHC